MYIIWDVATYYVLHIELHRKSCPQNYNSASAIVERAINGAHISSGHALICDHFYTSVDLARTLLERGVTLTGTCIQRRRFVPDIMKDDALRRDEDMGEMRTKQIFSDSISLVTYIPQRHFFRNFKSVLMLSTEFQLPQQVLVYLYIKLLI